MKKILPILLSTLMLVSLAACAGSNNPSESNVHDGTPAVSTDENKTKPSDSPSNTSSSEPADSQPNDTEAGKKVLVAYFSATGTTKKLAEYAADAMDADIYEIVPRQPYTDADLDYNTDCRANREMNDPDSRPAISGGVDNMADYDVVFIGYPIWWGEAPRIISTFMESYDFSEKTIVPFCTSGSSGIGSSARNLHSLASDSAIWLDGDRFAGGSSRDDMAEWINGLGLDITYR